MMLFVVLSGYAVYIAWPGTGFLDGIALIARGFNGLGPAEGFGILSKDPTEALLRRESAIGLEGLGPGDIERS